MKRRLIVLGLSGALLGAGVVGAQQAGSTAAQNQESQASGEQAGSVPAGANAQHAVILARMLLHRPLDMGSTLTVTFYDGDPEAGGSEQRSLEFVYGEDSEAAFAEQVETAAADAAYLTVTTSPQTETFNLSEMHAEGPGGFGGMHFGDRGPGRFGQGGFGEHHR